MEPSAQWSALPSDILTTIAAHLHLNSSFSLHRLRLRLRAVCSSWRNAIPLHPCHSPPPLFPLIISPPTTPSCHLNPTLPGNFGDFSVVQSTVLRLSPLSPPTNSNSNSVSWLLKVSQTNPNTNTFSLLNPLSTTKIKQFHGNPTSINLLDFRVSEIAVSYHLNFAGGSPVYVRKVVVLSDMSVLILSYGGKMERWRFGDHSWAPLLGEDNNKRDRNYHFDDAICFRNQCYAINISGILVKFDSDFSPVEITSPMGYSPSEQKYLVPGDNDDDDLFLVSKISDPDPEFYYDYGEDEFILNEETFEMPIKMRVFKLNWKRGDWCFTGSLDDKALFLGDDVSFSISVRDFDGCRGNCIYLTEECFYQDDDEDNVYGQDSGFYALDEPLAVRLAAAPEYARVFWPPPPWLLQGTTSAGN